MKKLLPLFTFLMISTFIAQAQCDSVIIKNLYDYEEDLQERTTTLYNPEGHIQFTECYNQDQYGIWKPYTRTDYSYDLNDSLILKESKFFANGIWTINSRQVSLFTIGGQRLYTSLSGSSGGSLIILSSDTLWYDAQDRISAHLYYVSSGSTRILFAYNSLSEDTLQLTQQKDSLGNWNDTEKSQRYFDGNGLINIDTVYTWNSLSWIYQKSDYFYFNGDTLLDSLILNQYAKVEYDYYSSGLLYHRYDLQWTGSTWQYNTQYTFFYDQYNNLLHDAIRSAIYDSLGNLTFDFPPGLLGNEVYDQYGNILSYSGHGDPGGPYDGHFTFTAEGAPLTGYTFYSTMGEITTTRYINYYYAEVKGDTGICSGSTTTLSLDSCAGNAYLWSNGATGASIQVSAGDYSATITHANGTIVNTPTVHIAVSNAIPYFPSGIDSTYNICGNFYLQLYSPAQANTIYQWYRNDTALTANTNSNLSIYGGVPEGDYYLIASNGCGSDTSATTTIHINQVPAVPTITSSTGSFLFCAGDSITLSGSPANSYLWLPENQTTASINVNRSGYYTLYVFDSNGCSTWSQVLAQTQTIPQKPSLFLSNGTITMNVGALQYQWLLNGDTIPGATSSSYVPLTGGYYSIALQNYVPCSIFSDSIYINPSGMTVDAGTDKHICMNGNVYFTYANPVVGGTPPYVFFWSSGVTTTGNGTGYMMNVSSNQTCILTVIDSLGNTATDSVHIIIESPVIPQVSLTGTPCDGEHLVARVNNQIFPGQLQHWILNGDTLGNSQPLMIYGSGTISAYYMDQYGCKSASETDTIYFSPRTPLHLNATFDSAACVNGNGTFWVDAVAGATYTWRQGGTIVGYDTIYTTTYPDNYYVYQTDSNGCERSLYFEFDSFNSEFIFNLTSANEHNCDSTILIAPLITNATYQWAMNGIQLSETTNILQTNSLGDYTCQFTMPSGCTGNGSRSILNWGAIPVNIVQAGNTLHYDGNGTGYVYFQWFLNGQEIPGAVQSSYTPLVSGDYALRIYTTYTCYCWSNLYHFPSCSVSILTTIPEVCIGECTAELGTSVIGAPPFQYAWSNGGTNDTIDHLCAGSYTITITDSLGCIASSIAIVGNDSVAMSTTVTGTTCIGCDNGVIDAHFESGITPILFTITPPGLTEPSGHFPNLPPGIYTVCMQDALGCFTCIVDTIFEDPTIIETIKNLYVSISPNPATNTLTILSPVEVTGKIFTIRDILNKEVFIGRITGIRQAIPIGHLTPGVYFVSFPGEVLKPIRFVKE